MIISFFMPCLLAFFEVMVSVGLLRLTHPSIGLDFIFCFVYLCSMPHALCYFLFNAPRPESALPRMMKRYRVADTDTDTDTLFSTQWGRFHIALPLETSQRYSRPGSLERSSGRRLGCIRPRGRVLESAASLLLLPGPVFP
jgi:hypothetical protein